MKDEKTEFVNSFDFARVFRFDKIIERLKEYPENEKVKFIVSFRDENVGNAEFLLGDIRMLQAFIAKNEEKYRFVSEGTVLQFYHAVKKSGLSYNQLRQLFDMVGLRNNEQLTRPSSGIEPNKTNKDAFIDGYVKPLDLMKLDDATKLVRFARLLFGHPELNEKIEVERLLGKLHEEGWRIEKNMITWTPF